MTDDTDLLADLIREVSRALRRRTVAIVEPYGLTAHQYRAMRMIAQGTPTDHKVVTPLRLSDIAERLRIVARSATDVIDDLEAKGFVQRAPHPTDRRSTVVLLTARGRDVLDEVEEHRAVDARQFFARLDAAERRQLVHLLHRLEP
ncbi:MarR family winged helix-turn-helix transcriptional regulator [Cumulibacter manganitolerans]|uniref:MarR family winged helix-turn-helix transcriptional regulator n=1 Tax=Cumulibacter manganitolerans TaxID=1884992 RepID=UPI001885E80D|nr:MarR family transcriptional regulator [Cumulibacter manganitolerans]